MLKKDKLYVEKRLIEQEHRVIHVLKNRFSKNWREADPRKNASTIAYRNLLIRFAFMMIPLLGVGVIGLASPYFMYKQTKLMQESNDVVKKQIMQSIEQFEKNYRVIVEELRLNESAITQDIRFKLLEYLYTTKGKQTSEKNHKFGLYPISDPKFNQRLREQAIIELLNLEKSIVEERKKRYFATPIYPKSQAPDTPFKINFNGLLLQNTTFSTADFRGVDISYTNFYRTNCFNCNFRLATLSNVNFEKSLLISSDFSGADLSGSNMHGANLNIIKWNKDTTVTNLNLTGVKNAPKEFIEFAKTNGAVFTDSEWENRKSSWINNFDLE